MMIRKNMRPLVLAAAFFATTVLPAYAAGDDQIQTPVLRATVNITGDIVRVGDLIDNAGAAAQVAVYRAPDLGTTGMLPTAQVISALRSHQVIGVDTRGITQIAVTRQARTVDTKEIEQAVARALEHRAGLGDAVNISVGFDQPIQDMKLDASFDGSLTPTDSRYDPRTGRYEVSFDIGGGGTSTNATRLRFTGTAIETTEVAVLTRNVERGELLRSGDLVVERRARAELGGSDPASRDMAVGMQMRRQAKAGQSLRTQDLAKPDLVTRDQNITIIFQTAGIYLTTRGKALDTGSEGDVVSVLNLQSKRTVTGRVTGRGQVSVDIAVPKPPQTAQADIAAPVSVANNLPSSVTPKAE